MATLRNEKLRRNINNRQYRLRYYSEVINNIVDEISRGNIKKVISNNIYLDFVFNYYILNSDEIDFALNSDISELYLHDLFKHQVLNEEQITNFIKKADIESFSCPISSLFMYQVLNEKQVDIALQRYLKIRDNSNWYTWLDLGCLYRHQKLTDNQISKAISFGKSLEHLYRHQKLSARNINKALSKGKELDILYKHQIKGKGKLKFIPKT